MIYKALSMVSPSGSSIAKGIKTIEVRSWLPESFPLLDVVIVENKKYLSTELPIDTEAYAVAIVDFRSATHWNENEVTQACSKGWVPGYYAWHIENVRIINDPMKVEAKLRMYELEWSKDYFGESSKD